MSTITLGYSYPDHTLTCDSCGHSEWWESGGYFGERIDFAHHVCGQPGYYGPCGMDCWHDFPGCDTFRSPATLAALIACLTLAASSLPAGQEKALFMVALIAMALAWTKRTAA